MGIGNITKSSLVSQAWDNIKSMLDNRTNIPDPVDSTGNRKIVYSREPDHKARNFAGYPYIIVHQPSLEQDRYSIDRSKATQIYEQEIEIRTSDYMPNSAYNGKGLNYTNQIVDDVLEYFGSSSARSTLRSNGHFNLKLRVDRIDQINSDTELVFRAIIMLRYELRIAV